MKATVVLIAGVEAENYGRDLMYRADKIGGTGYEMARLPQHVSLKQPFSIPSLPEMEAFFDDFADGIAPVKIQFEELGVYPSDVIGKEASGCMAVGVKKTIELAELQKSLFEKLEARFGPCPAEHDEDYWFHMTIAISKARYANYEKAYRELCKLDYKCEFVFDRLGLFYYDDDACRPGTYFCYKQLELKGV